MLLVTQQEVICYFYGVFNCVYFSYCQKGSENDSVSVPVTMGLRCDCIYVNECVCVCVCEAVIVWPCMHSHTHTHTHTHTVSRTRRQISDGLIVAQTEPLCSCHSEVDGVETGTGQTIITLTPHASLEARVSVGCSENERWRSKSHRTVTTRNDRCRASELITSVLF